MKVLVFVVLSTALLLGAQERRRADYTLDVVAYGPIHHAADPREPAGIASGSLGAAAGDKTSVVLRATLVGLDRSDYEIGTPLIYEVLIENAGKAPAFLPWSPDRASVQRQSTTPSMVQGFLTIFVRDRGRSKDLTQLDTQALYGSRSAPGTLQRLAPGESALIRAPAAWQSTEGALNRVLTQTQGAVEVRAELTLMNPIMVVQSQNAIPVDLRAPRRN
jgi:hypothetical protein